MKLADLRKLSIRKQLKIRFQLPNGMECVITEHGIAQIPALSHVPDFNLEQELEHVSEFMVEPAQADVKSAQKPKSIGRSDLAAMTATGPAAAADHDDE